MSLYMHIHDLNKSVELPIPPAQRTPIGFGLARVEPAAHALFQHGPALEAPRGIDVEHEHRKNPVPISLCRQCFVISHAWIAAAKRTFLLACLLRCRRHLQCTPSLTNTQTLINSPDSWCVHERTAARARDLSFYRCACSSCAVAALQIISLFSSPTAA